MDDSEALEVINRLLVKFDGQKKQVKSCLMRWWHNPDEAQIDRLLESIPNTVEQVTPIGYDD